MKNLFKFLISFIFITSFSNAQTPGAGVTIDEYTYPTVIINGNEWLAENLHATHYDNGVSFVQLNMSNILNAPIAPNTPAGFINPTSTGSPYGLLYNYNIVNVWNNGGTGSTTNIIKTGWHVATKADWDGLISFIGNTEIRKSTTNNIQYCTTCSPTNGADIHGFGAVPSGRFLVNDASTSVTPQFNGTNNQTGALFWALSNDVLNKPFARVLCNIVNGVNSFVQLNTTNQDGSVTLINPRSALSVRLVKDINPLSNNNFDKLKISVYPNPVNDILNIDTEYSIESVQIFDITGKTIISLKDVKTIDVNQLQTGIYILKVYTDSGVLTQKIVKK